MNVYTYDFEILTMSTVFMNAMSDIVVKRFDGDKEVKDRIKTRVVYAPKQRVLNDLLDKDQNIQLPVIAITIGGIARDETRVFNKLQGNFHRSTQNADIFEYDRTPVPIDITFNVSILTRYQQDMDQILSHLLPYINPYFVVSWRTPQRPDFEIRSNVYWSGQASIQYPNDITNTTVARVAGELSFVFKGWLFRNLGTAKPIFTVDTTIASKVDPFLYQERDEFRTGEYDNFVYNAVPAKPQIVEPKAGKVDTESSFFVWGTGFEKMVNVYLSGSAVADISTKQNPFGGTNLETTYPAFNGIKLDPADWKLASENNYLIFTLPKISREGCLDVIVENPYSYGSLLTNMVSIPEIPLCGIKITKNTVFPRIEIS